MKTYKKPSWAINQTVRETGLVEDVCKHGIGHPNEEFLEGLSVMRRNNFRIHGCCGCCCDDMTKIKQPIVSNLKLKEEQKETVKEEDISNDGVY
jgi:hypothetical protein